MPQIQGGFSPGFPLSLTSWTNPAVRRKIIPEERRKLADQERISGLAGIPKARESNQRLFKMTD